MTVDINNSNVKVVGTAFEISDLPKEIQDMIGGYKRALIMPVAEERYEAPSGKVLRDFMIADCEGEENNVYIKYMDYCEEQLRMIVENVIPNLGGVSLDQVGWIRQMFELLCGDFMESYTEDGVDLYVCIDQYTNGKYKDLLDFVYKTPQEGKYGITSYMFEHKVVYKDCKYELEKYSSAVEGLTAYIEGCLMVSNFIAYEPIDNFFVIRCKDEMGMSRHSYYDSKSFVRYEMDDASDVARYIVNNMYDCNLKLYLWQEMSIHNMIEYKDGEIRVFDWYNEWLDDGVEINTNGLDYQISRQ